MKFSKSLAKYIRNVVVVMLFNISKIILEKAAELTVLERL